MTTSLPLATVERAKKTRFQWNQPRAEPEPAGLFLAHKTNLFFWGRRFFRPFSGEVFGLRFGLEEVQNSTLEKSALKALSDSGKKF
jgi:hypothetical protein